MPEHQSIPVRKERGGAVANARPPLHGLRSEIDRLFDDFMSWSPFRGIDMPPAALSPRIGMPAADYIERDKDYEIDIDVPGLTKDNIEVSLTDHRLTVRCNVAEEREEKGKQYYFSERRHEAFARTFDLPSGVDNERVEADLKERVLKIVLPKTAEAQKQARKIEIKQH